MRKKSSVCDIMEKTCQSTSKKQTEDFIVSRSNGTYLATEKKRLDGRDGGIAASTVKRYTTVLRSIVTMAYKLEYIEDDIGRSRRIEFPKEETKKVETHIGQAQHL